jgi:archaetidylinositol phosphate synthase
VSGYAPWRTVRFARAGAGRLPLELYDAMIAASARPGPGSPPAYHNPRDPGAIRIQESVLAPIERRLLIWLARRMPAFVTPDKLTALGLISLAFAGLLYALASRWPLALLAVNLFIALNWFGDSLDGTLARVRNKQRPRYGFYVDHAVDAVGATFILTGMAVSGFVTASLAVGMLVAFLLVSVESYLATYALGRFRLSHWKFGPTELRILLAIGNVYAFFKPVVIVIGSEFKFFDVGFACGIVGLGSVLVRSLVRNTRELYRAERV